MDEQSIFGYCEKCGLVYALKGRMTDEQGRVPSGPKEGIEKEETNGTEGVWSPAHLATIEPGRSSRSRWRCPDCDAEIDSENDSDLEFAKREHIREYHPNRGMG